MNPYQIVMNVPCLFVQAQISLHLMAGQLPLRIIDGELYFTYGKGPLGGGAYYLGGAGCMRGNTVHRKNKEEVIDYVLRWMCSISKRPLLSFSIHWKRLQ